ncbi:hypothetical protein BRC61_06925 [Halobacteriales archaeon QH_10_65_19]|nr:MAG: hypothetical protein BRC61_06925 [Halobacteriales archaeon QH_10_65_19]
MWLRLLRPGHRNQGPRDGRENDRHRGRPPQGAAGPHGRPPRTGNRDVMRAEHFERMHDGAMLANAGHFDVEIDVDALADLAKDVTTPKEGVTRYHIPDGRRLNLLAGGRLVNLTGPYSQGHPAEVMDTTFAMMFVAAYDMLVDGTDLSPGLYNIPDRLDREVAGRKLDTLGLSVEEMTESQRAYTEEWEHPDSSF